MIRPTWNTSKSSGHDDGADDGECREGELIEANITLKPRRGDDNKKMPFKNLKFHPSSMIPTSNLSEEDEQLLLETSLHVDLIVEKVGLAWGGQGQEHRHGGGGDKKGMGKFPMTQTPFPIDDAKLNLLRVREHLIFKGVVDHYTVEKLSTSSNVEGTMGSGGGGGGKTPSKSATKVNVNGGITSAMSTISAASKIGSAHSSAEANLSKKSATKKIVQAKKKEKGEDDDGNEAPAPQKTGSAATMPASAPKKISSTIKNAPTPNKLAEVEKDNKDGSSSQHAKSTAKKSSSTPNVESMEKDKSSKMKKMKKKKKQMTELALEEAERVEETDTNGGIADATEQNTSTHATAASAHKDDKTPPPKRPPNGYMVFHAEIRPKLLAQYPELSVTELVRIIFLSGCGCK